MKKVLAVLLSLALVLSLGLVAFATGTPEEPTQPDTDSVYDAANGGFSIVIDNAIAGETYDAYKVFHVTYANDVTAEPATNADGSDATSEHGAYSYTITPASPWWSVVTAGAAPELSTDPVEFTAKNLKFTKSTAKDGDEFIYVVEADANFSAYDFAAYLAANIPAGAAKNSATAVADSRTQTEEDIAKNIQRGTATIAVPGAGYYFVTTTTGALCSLDTTEPTAKIVEKNSVPDVDKKVSDKAGEGWSDKTDLDVGDTAYFKIEVTTGVGNNGDITLHDTMTESLTLNRKTGEEDADITFTITDKNGVVDPANYTITYGASHTTGEGDDAVTTTCTFDIVFKAAYILALGDNETITVQYDATLNEGARIYPLDNPNTTHIDYSNQSSTEKTVKVYSYEFDIVKVDTEGNLLPGAEFTLTRNAATKRDGETDPIKFVKEGDGYRVAKDGEEGTTTILASEDGKYHIYGLDAGVYTLTETKAPTGYNLLKDPVTIVVKGVADGEQQGHIYNGSGDSWQTALYKETVSETVTDAEGQETTTETEKVLPDTVEVVNDTGTELPSTGGIGTTIFYIVGGVLLLGAVVVLIARRRMRADA